MGLVASLAGVLAWYFREVSQRRLPAPRFFVIAFLVHVLLATGSFFVYLDNGAGAQIRQRLTRIVAAAGLPLEKLRRSLRPADDGFGKVADLRSVTTESPVAGPILTARVPPLPSAGMTAPVEPLGRMLPAARFAAPPGEAIANLDLRSLPRRRAAVAVAAEPIGIEPLRAAGQPSAPRIEGVERRHGPRRGGRRASRRGGDTHRAGVGTAAGGGWVARKGRPGRLCPGRLRPLGAYGSAAIESGGASRGARAAGEPRRNGDPLRSGRRIG